MSPLGSLPPTTTSQQDLTHAGQRKINLIWEVTQAFIAVIVIGCNMIIAVLCGISAINGKPATMPEVLSSAMFLIIGFYFSRTNHQAIGGTGHKQDKDQEYLGR